MAIKQLNASHYIAIYELAKPNSTRLTQEEIAALAGVHRTTLHAWRKDPLFTRELKQQIVRGTIDKLPDVFAAIPEIIIRDGNAAMFKNLLQVHGMLTDKVEVTNVDEAGSTIDREALKAKLAKLKGEAPNE